MHAIHVHHGLHSAADQWAAQCQELCETLAVPLNIQQVDAKAKLGESPEEAARNARYAVFKSLLDQGDLLLMAHHQEDQAETVLLQLLRGAGVEGISGMPDCAPFAKGHLLRPLLQATTDQISGYAQQYGLRWVNDPSNQDQIFDRNYLRHTIMPLIKTRWPAAARALSRSARHAAGAANLQRKHQLALAEALAPENHFDLYAARELDPVDLRLAVRGWFARLRLRMPSEQMTETFIEQLIGADIDRMPMILLPDGSRLQRYRDVAYHIPAHKEPLACDWSNWRSSLELPGGNGSIAMTWSRELMTSSTIWDTDTIHIRYRIGGERIKLEGHQGWEALKDLFQEFGIPPWLRPRIPLVYLGNRLASVGGFWTNAEVFPASIWASSPRPCWIPPEGLDPTGSLNTLKTESVNARR